MGVDFLDRRVLAKRVVDGRKPASGHESQLRQGVASGHPQGRSAAKEPQSGLTRRNPLTFDPTCCGFSHSLFAIYARFYAAVKQVAVRRMNFDGVGFRSLMRKTIRIAPALEGGSVRDALIAADRRWAEPDTWAVVKRSTRAVTPFYLLVSVDLMQDRFGDIVSRPRDEAIFIGIFWRTIKLGLVVTAACFLLAYPLAHLLAHLPRGTANALMILVLVPFWTSLLVRTSSWIVLLQREGIVNDSLVSLGIFPEPVQMIYNRTGVYVAMIQVLLPFMILPIYNTMIKIPPTYMRAAISLGAHPLTAFRKVYFPLTMPGVSAGCLLVFFLSLGYYITPALVGGPADQMVAYFIAFYTNQTINWGLASALAAVLLLLTVVIFAIHRMVIGADSTVKLG